jgi:hypothetical protein
MAALGCPPQTLPQPSVAATGRHYPWAGGWYLVIQQTKHVFVNV